MSLTDKIIRESKKIKTPCLSHKEIHAAILNDLFEIETELDKNKCVRLVEYFSEKYIEGIFLSKDEDGYLLLEAEKNDIIRSAKINESTAARLLANIAVVNLLFVSDKADNETVEIQKGFVIDRINSIFKQ